MPPPGPPPALPYFVRRSRLHNLPVYRRLVKGNRRLTELRHVEGDIWVRGGGCNLGVRGRRGGFWGANGLLPPPCCPPPHQALERELRAFLGVPDLEVQVNEVTGSLQLKGHWERELRDWLLQRGF